MIKLKDLYPNQASFMKEEKCYPRDWTVVGRCKIKLFEEDGKTPVNPKILNSNSVVVDLPFVPVIVIFKLLKFSA